MDGNKEKKIEELRAATEQILSGKKRRQTRSIAREKEQRKRKFKPQMDAD